MTKSQVYAAKNMYEKHLKEIAISLKIDISYTDNMDNILLYIVSKTKRQSVLFDAIRFYKYYISMCTRISQQSWEEDEDDNI